MEALVYFVMSNGTMVVTVLLGSIILCVFGLLIMSFHNPKEMIANEVGTIDRLEGVLRQMLSDQSWPKPSAGGGSSATGDGGMADAMLQEQVKSLEAELQEKQKQIDAMALAGTNKPKDGNLTVVDAGVDVAPFKLKIKDLEEKLAEYSVIEEDIADLSRFRQENDDLRKKITEVTGVPAGEALTMPWDEFEKIVKEKKVTSVKEDVSTTIDAKNNNPPAVDKTE